MHKETPKLRLVSPQHFSFSQTFTSVSVYNPIETRYIFSISYIKYKTDLNN